MLIVYHAQGRSLNARLGDKVSAAPKDISKAREELSKKTCESIHFCSAVEGFTIDFKESRLMHV